MNFVNLTPHPVVIMTAGAETVTLPSAGVARVSSTSIEVAGIPVPGVGDDYIPIVSYPIYGAVEDLPAPSEGTAYIVSILVLAQCAGRRDVYAPATGPKDAAIRDKDGRITGVTRLVTAPLT